MLTELPELVILGSTIYLSIVMIFISILTSDEIKRIVFLVPLARYLRFFTQLLATKLAFEVIIFISNMGKLFFNNRLSIQLCSRSIIELSLGTSLGVILWLLVPLTLYEFEKTIGKVKHIRLL